MPVINGKKFAYTKKGISKAKESINRLGYKIDQIMDPDLVPKPRKPYQSPKEVARLKKESEILKTIQMRGKMEDLSKRESFGKKLQSAAKRALFINRRSPGKKLQRAFYQPKVQRSLFTLQDIVTPK